MTAVSLPVCPGPLAPVCAAAGGAGSTIVGAGASAVLSAMAGWVVTGAGWLLGQIGSVLSTTTRVDVGAAWFTTHYALMAAIGAAAILPMLLVSGIQAVYRQSPALLVRSALVHLPLAALLTGVAVQLVQLSLAATDALCTTVSSGAGSEIDHVLTGLADALAQQAGGGPATAPMFVVLLGALLVAAGSLVLWLELLVRAAAVYVAVLFLPLGLASLVWPAVTHWCRRLVDTLVALVLSKFVMVAILSLATGALASGTSTGFSAVLGGGALLLLAAFAPFVLLRLVPAVEAGGVHQLEGARQRLRHAAVPLPPGAAAHALRGLWEAHRPALEPGAPGTVLDGELAVAGAGLLMAGGGGGGGLGTGGTPPRGAGGGGQGGSGRAGPGHAAADAGLGVPDLPGQPASDAAFWETVHGGRPPHPPPDGTIPGITGAPVWSHDDPGDGGPSEGAAGGSGNTGHGGGGDGAGGDGGGGDGGGRGMPVLGTGPDPTEWGGGFADGGWDGGSRRHGHEEPGGAR